MPSSNALQPGDLAQMISDGFEVAKKGDALRVFSQLVPYHDNGAIERRSHYPFGWIIYYALHQTDASDIDGRKHLLARYLKLHTPRPHKLHSMILTEAIRLHKDVENASFGKTSDRAPSFSITSFCDIWDVANLRPGDHARKEFEGKQLSSTTEKLVTCIVNECESKSAVPNDAIIALIDHMIELYPDTFNLLSQRATIHLIAGQPKEAAQLLRKALLLAPGKFYLWHKLAMTHSSETEMRLHVSLLYKALKAPGPEQYKGRVRIALAEAFMGKGLREYALWELRKIDETYKSNGWHLPRNAQKMLNEIPDGLQPKNPYEIYHKLESLADDELYASLPQIEMTKTYHKDPDRSKPGKYGHSRVAWRITDAATNTNIWIQPEKFGLPADLPIGTRLLVRIHDNKVVHCSLS